VVGQPQSRTTELPKSLRRDSRKCINEAFFSAVCRAVRDTEVGSLFTGRSDGVIVLCHADQDWERFRARIMDRIGPQRSCRVAVGGPCVEPCEYPRSYRQARLALRMQVATGSPEQVTVFDDLGIYQLLSQIRDMSTVDEFIHRWLGTLISYDATKDAQLVDTLAAYLDVAATTTSRQRRCHCIAVHCVTGCNGSARCPAMSSTTRTRGFTFNSPLAPGPPCTPCASCRNQALTALRSPDSRSHSPHPDCGISGLKTYRVQAKVAKAANHPAQDASSLILRSP